jgi:hypothetical protein
MLQNIVMSWVLVDYIELVMRSNGVQIQKTDYAKKRNLCTAPKNLPTYTLVTKNGGTRNVFLVADYTNYWGRQKNITFRDDKYSKVKEYAAIIMAVDVKNKKNAYFNCSEIKRGTRVQSDGCYGGKPTFSVDVDTIKFAPLKPPRVPVCGNNLFDGYTDLMSTYASLLNSNNYTTVII